MNLEQRIEGLKQEVELMKQCYHKGFGNKIYSIYINCDVYFNFNDLEKQEKENLKSLALENLHIVNKEYEKIPFEDLKLDDFAPLFVVRDLLKNYSKEVSALFEKQEKDKLNIIYTSCSAIVEVGRIYNSNFREKIKELRSMPGQAEYPIILIDYKGREYGM